MLELGWESNENLHANDNSKASVAENRRAGQEKQKQNAKKSSPDGLCAILFDSFEAF